MPSTRGRYWSSMRTGWIFRIVRRILHRLRTRLTRNFTAFSRDRGFRPKATWRTNASGLQPSDKRQKSNLHKKSANHHTELPLWLNFCSENTPQTNNYQPKLLPLRGIERGFVYEKVRGAYTLRASDKLSNSCRNSASRQTCGIERNV